MFFVKIILFVVPGFGPALFVLGEFILRGQITFFDFKKHFGIVIAETGERHFLSGHDLANPVDRNDWVAFDSEPSLVSGAECNLVAKNVRRIECPPEYLLQGTVTKFFPDLGYGFVKYENDGRIESIFFHCNDLLRIDGVEQVPCVGCEVSFCLGQKFDRQIAAQIWIERRLESELTFEEQFAAAEELPIDVPAPVAAPQSSVLAPETKNLSLSEIIRQRQKGNVK